MDINSIPPDDRGNIIEQYSAFCHDLIDVMESDGVLFDAITKWNDMMNMKYQAAYISFIQSQDLREELVAEMEEMQEDNPEGEIK